jgi:hypothetical protein
MARKKKVVVETLADLIAKHNVPEEGYAIKEGYEDLEPEELIIQETQDESTTN